MMVLRFYVTASGDRLITTSVGGGLVGFMDFTQAKNIDRPTTWFSTLRWALMEYT